MLLAIPAAKALNTWLAGPLPSLKLNVDFVVEYAQKYIALVGTMPTIMGLMPLKKPFGPSFCIICCATTRGLDFPIRLDCS